MGVTTKQREEALKLAQEDVRGDFWCDTRERQYQKLRAALLETDRLLDIAVKAIRVLAGRICGSDCANREPPMPMEKRCGACLAKETIRLLTAGAADTHQRS